MSESTTASVGVASGRAAPPIFISSKHNSPQDHSSDDAFVAEYPSVRCPNARLIKGRCRSHGYDQWFMFPCKARDCSVCGPLTRMKHAYRIDHGIKALGECWYLVLTFRESAACDPAFKSVAVRRVNKFLDAMRKELALDFAFAKSWELTKAGRLHCNVVFNCPWSKFIPFAKLIALWGARLTFEEVTDGRRLSNYVTKVASDVVSNDSMGRYVTKAGYQCLPREWGRRVTYSKNWPREVKRLSHVLDWERCTGESTVDFYSLQFRGVVKEVAPGRWSRSGEVCGCFGHCPGSAVDIVFSVFPGSRLIDASG